MRKRPRSEPGASSQRVVGSVLAGGVGQQTLVDLAQRDGEGLLLRGGVDQRADVLEQALGELAVVGVDLTRALGGEDDQAVLAAGALEQLVDRRVGDGLRGGGGPRARGGGGLIFWVGPRPGRVRAGARPPEYPP